MKKILKGKKILITAGPVWVPIDKVRVITNIFGGSLGNIIAELAYKMGAKVTLLMGPGRTNVNKSKKNYIVIKYKYYNEIYRHIRHLLKNVDFDVMVHSAAISDYTPVNPGKGKIKSGKKELVIRFKPTVKIIDRVKTIRPSIFLVKFKLEVNKSSQDLLQIAYKSMLNSNADLIVANDFKSISKGHIAYIIDKNNNHRKIVGKQEIAKQLLTQISKSLKK